jgi:hypothetical protein
LSESFQALQTPRHLQSDERGSLATLQVMQRPLYQGASDLHSSKLKSPCRSIGGFIRKPQGFFLSTHAQDIGILWQVAFQQ